MDSETRVTTNRADKILNGLKLSDLRVVLTKINVGKCIPLPGKVGFSIQYLPSAAINLTRKRLVLATGKPFKRKSRRLLDTSTCCSGFCLGCTSGKRCSKLKRLGPKVKYTVKKGSKYERIKQIAGHKPDPKLGSLYQPETSTQSSLHSASCFIGEGELQQTLHMVTPARQEYASYSVGVATGSDEASSSPQKYHLHSFLPELSSSSFQQETTVDNFILPGTMPDQMRNDNSVLKTGSTALGNVTETLRHGETSTSVREAGTVHVVFSQENTIKEPNSLLLNTCNMHPSGSLRSFVDTASSPALPVNNGGESSQQYRLSSTAPAAPKDLPLLPSVVNTALPQLRTAGPPRAYPPSGAIPLHRHQGWQQSGIPCVSVGPDATTGIPPGDLSLNNGVGGPVMENLPPVPSVSIARNSRSTATMGAAPQNNPPQEIPTVAATQRAFRFPRGEKARAKTKTVEEACDQLTQILKTITKRKQISGDFSFLVARYRSSLKQDPANAIIIDGLESLKVFLKIAECKLKADSYALQKSCLSLQSVIETYQESIRADGVKYKKVLLGKLGTERSITRFKNFTSACKQQDLSEMEAELAELEDKMVGLKRERDALYEKWLKLADDQASDTSATKQ